MQEGLINQRYKRIKKLGTGSQGIVFQVEDIQDGNKLFENKIFKV